MKLTDKQAIVLFQIAMDSLRISDNRTIFSFDHQYRLNLVNNIISQQNNEVIDIDIGADVTGIMSDSLKKNK